MLFISGWYTRACARIQPKSDATTLTSIFPFPLQLICCYTLSSQEVMLTVSLKCHYYCQCLVQETFSVLNERFSIWWPKDNIHPILHVRPEGAIQPPRVSLLLLLFAGFKSKVHSSVHMDRFICENNCQLVFFLLLFLFYFLSVHWFIIGNIVKILHGDFEGRTGQEKGRNLF